MPGGEHLIDRRPRLDVGALGPLRVDDTRHEARLGERVSAAALRSGAQIGDDIQMRAEGFERLEDRRQVEARARALRRPMAHDHAVGRVHGAEATHGPRSGLGEHGRRGNHGIEQRQRDSRTKSSQERPAGQRHPGDDHDGDLLIWNGTLVEMPTMMDVKLALLPPASLTIFRIAGWS